MCRLRLSPFARDIFNCVYFGGAIAAFAWVLRPPFHWRAIPIAAAIWMALYGALFLASMLSILGSRPGASAAPNPLSYTCRQKLRMIAILIPIPFFVYCGVYYKTLCLTKGNCNSLRKVVRVAHFEKASFCKKRAEMFLSNVKAKWIKRAERLEAEGRTRQARQIMRHANRLAHLEFMND